MSESEIPHSINNFNQKPRKMGLVIQKPQQAHQLALEIAQQWVHHILTSLFYQKYHPSDLASEVRHSHDSKLGSRVGGGDDNIV